MSDDIDLEKVLEEARKIVRNAIDIDEITNLTPRIVRARVEEALSLPARILDGSDYKSAISEAVNEVTSQHEEEKEKTPVKVKKRKSSDDKESKRQTKRTKRLGDDKADVAEASKPKSANNGKSAPSDVENRSSRSRKSKKAGFSKKSTSSSKVDTDDENARGRKQGKTFLSADTIDDSDIEMNSPVVASTSKVDEAVNAPVEVRSSKGAEAKPNSRRNETSPAVKAQALEKDDQKSESEMSILEDERPNRKGKSKGKVDPKASAEKAKGSKKSRSKKPAQELSKDEETIKRLKSFVVACGVRKAWAKEFKDLDTPSQQIKRLKEILSDLGMSGRMSLEQAKSIRAQREFAQELEDVKSFEQAVVGRKSRSSTQAHSKSESEDYQESESGEEAVPAKKRLNARRSIMAFLQDQSDDE